MALSWLVQYLEGTVLRKHEGDVKFDWLDR